MRTRAGFVPAVALTVAASSACEIVRPVDPLEAHPDVVAIAILLVAGESEARLLAIHPHRQRYDQKPQIGATLEGPGWTAGFTRELRLPACGQVGGSWHVPGRCLAADLPAAIEAGGTYGLRGEAALGSFEGETTVPAVPLLVEPAEPASSWLPLPDTSGLVYIPVRSEVGPNVGTLLADPSDVLETLAHGIEVEIPVSNLGPFPEVLANADDTISIYNDTIAIYADQNPLRFTLRVFAVGWHYTNFVKYTGVDPLPGPLPDFGVEGEGVYGYFDGVAHSEFVRMAVGNVGGDPSRISK
ncbi:MAG: hypothetical protein OXU64_01095 [Gemmatimonadota bacterium]|nr:hypothetical protein [Gemmatimonadota bacterium]